MAVEFKLPALGENVESADVVNVLVKVGDTIKKEQGVLEAETAKAVMEIPSDVAGKVTAVHIKKGDKVKPGQAIISVEPAAAGAEKAAPAKGEAKPEQAKAADQPKSPAIGEATKQEARAEVAKDDAAKEEAARAQHIASSPDAPKTVAAGSPTAPAGDKPPVAAAPSVRQFAREIGVDIHEVPGTGDGGRISIDDVKAHARARATGGNGAVSGATSAGPRVSREPMSKIRKVTAEHMARCWNQVPHVTIFDKADVTDLEALRDRSRKKAESQGVKLTITHFFMKLAAAGLKAFPNLNASIDMAKGEVEKHNYVNLGVAVDTPRGLIVPVLRDVDRKNVFEIARELGELSNKARAGKLVPDEMSGGTFTITNLGSIGTGFFTPIVNLPEVAILGMGRAVHEPVWDGEGFEPRLMAPLSLSFDHRLVDGADGARFLRWLIEAVQNPMMVVMEG